jgi:hypothetical protein
MAVAHLDASAIHKARSDYPGYLPIRSRVYADAWAEIARTDGEPPHGE